MNTSAPQNQIHNTGTDSPRAMRYAVVASAKSGTTWVQRLLSAHPAIHCAEARAFGKYFDPHNPTAIHISIEQLVLTMQSYYHPPSGVDQNRFYDDVLFRMVDAVGTTTMAHSGKPIYGEKITPFLGTATQVMDRLHAYNPQLRLVHLVRDPRDVVVSGFVHQANIRMHAGHPEVDTYRRCLDEQRVDTGLFDFLLALWLDSTSATAHNIAHFEHSLVLRYEDLLNQPVEQAARLIAFIGGDASMASDCVDRASFRSLSGGRASGEEDRSSFFRKGIAGDWMNWLSDEQVMIIHDRAGSLMERFGYAQEACT